jgi:hypothetical protein
MEMMRTLGKLATVASLLLLSTFAANAQTRIREVSIAIGGVSLDAIGNGPVVTIATSQTIASTWLLAQFAMGYASVEQIDASTIRIGLAEGQVQAQLAERKTRPYIGIGGGWLHYFNTVVPSRPRTSATISSAAGVRRSLSQRALICGEVRLRGWRGSGSSGFFNGGTQYTVGLGYTF